MQIYLYGFGGVLVSPSNATNSVGLIMNLVFFLYFFSLVIINVPM